MRVDIKYVGTREETEFAYDLLTGLMAESYLNGWFEKYQESSRTYLPIYSINKVLNGHPVGTGDA